MGKIKLIEDEEQSLDDLVKRARKDSALKRMMQGEIIDEADIEHISVHNHSTKMRAVSLSRYARYAAIVDESDEVSLYELKAGKLTPLEFRKTIPLVNDIAIKGEPRDDMISFAVAGGCGISVYHFNLRKSIATTANIDDESCFVSYTQSGKILVAANENSWHAYDTNSYGLLEEQEFSEIRSVEAVDALQADGSEYVTMFFATDTGLTIDGRFQRSCCPAYKINDIAYDSANRLFGAAFACDDNMVRIANDLLYENEKVIVNACFKYDDLRAIDFKNGILAVASGDTLYVEKVVRK
jgi:hypothetical protein